MKKSVLLLILLFLYHLPSVSQDSLTFNPETRETNSSLLSGFVRGGFYSWIDDADNKPYVSSAFSDFGIKAETGNGLNFRAFADLRFRYGTEFLEPVSQFAIREAYVKVNGKKWDISAGQEIVKWGWCDFTNPSGKLNPVDLLSRSPDREDMDMGNLLASAKIYPLQKISLEAVVVPFYRSSRLIIDPVPLPEYVTINKLRSLETGKEMFSYGIRADFHLKGFDWGLAWFDGFDPMPGIALSEFNLNLVQPVVTDIQLSLKPWRNRVLTGGFEAAAGFLGLRGEAAWSQPALSSDSNEYVPSPEINWVAGIDWSSGLFRITGEYSGKLISGFKPSGVDPLIGTELDYMELAELLAIPDFDPQAYTRQQVAAFNRLYNYQEERTYHSAGLRAEGELVYGKLLPSLFALYNFTSGDLLVIPEIRIKPSDGLAVTAGAEIYCGRKDSLYDLVNEFMNGFYVSMRVDF